MEFAGQTYLPLPPLKEPVIASILENVDQVVFGTVLYPTICDKAMYLLEALQASQLFPDGNKRVALATCEAFLYMNGKSFSDVSQKQKEIFVLGLANHKISKEKSVECCVEGLKKQL